jgi:hypothetical protein
MITLGSGTAVYDNNGLGFPNQYLPSLTIAGLFDDLYIYQGTQQGIYYEIVGETGSRQVIFEFYMSAYQRPTEYYHFSMTFYEDQPGVSLFKYYEVSRSGTSASIGVQQYSTGKSLVFAHLQHAITWNYWVKIDSVGGTYTAGNL